MIAFASCIGGKERSEFLSPIKSHYSRDTEKERIQHTVAFRPKIVCNVVPSCPSYVLVAFFALLIWLEQ